MKKRATILRQSVMRISMFDLRCKIDGCFVVKRISARMIYELLANQFYDKLESAYTVRQIQRSKTCNINLFSRAVNNIVDLWYTAWVYAG
jgi:hypothetical protein